MAEQKKKKRKKKRYILRFFILVALVIGAYYGMMSSLFEIRTVRVEGNSYYSEGEILRISGDPTGENLWNANLGAMRDLLVSDSYIEAAEVSRSIPDGVRIRVIERTEFCAVRAEDGYILLDKDGLVLRKTEEEPDLTILSGLTVSDDTPDSILTCAEQSLFRNTLALTHKMEDSNLWFREIECSEVTVRIVIFQDLVCEGTPENIMNNMDSLEEVLADLFEKGTKKGTLRISGDGSASFAPMPEEPEEENAADPMETSGVGTDAPIEAEPLAETGQEQTE